MKDIDPIKDISARDLAEKMLADLDDMIAEYKLQFKASATSGDSEDFERTVKLADKLGKYGFARKFIEEYISPIHLSMMEEYNLLKTDAQKDKFVSDQLTYADPFELLGSGILTKKYEHMKFGVTPPGNVNMYDIWSVIEVGDDYVKIMPDRPITYQTKYNKLVKTPVVMVGVGMDADEVRQQINWAYEGKEQ